MASNTGKMVIGNGGYVEIGVKGSASYHRIDVEVWFLRLKHIQKAVTHSGCGGVMTRKCVLQDWSGGFRYSYIDKTGDADGGNHQYHLQAGAELKIRFRLNNGDYYQAVGVVDEEPIESRGGPNEGDADVVKVDVSLLCAGPVALADGGPNLNNPSLYDPMIEPAVLNRA